MIKKYIKIFLIFLSFGLSGYRKPDVYVIDAVKNSNIHNNLGLMYMNEKYYYAAIEEFKIAISLNPESQASSVYYNNLGECFTLIGYPQLATDCFERAIKIYSLNLKYYINLAQNISTLKQVDKNLERFKDFSNPYNRTLTGVLYIENGDLQNGITILDNFTISEPKLIITPAIKAYIKSSLKKQKFQ